MASLELLILLLIGVSNAAETTSHRLPKQRKINETHLITIDVPDVGRIQGRSVQTFWDQKEIYQFLDVKYGESPSGELRFKPSVPAKKWNDVRPAYISRKGCPSLQTIKTLNIRENQYKDVEDCLHLSIYTKSLTTKLPVMIYIHGDFLYDGSSVEAQPGYLLEKDIVLVSVRYRLGPFGFMSTMTEEIPGNAAVTDIILALKWIQKHIVHFGGDPSQVTLFGQVGGAALINVLTMTPKMPQGLFHRVIYQSGSALFPAFITENPLPSAREIGILAGCEDVQNVEKLNRCFKTVNVTTILKAFSIHGNAHNVDGIGSYGGIQFVVGGPSGILAEHPGALLTKGKVKFYPTMGGSTKNAGTFILKDIYVDNFNETVPDDLFDGPGYINHIISQTNGADPSHAWRKFAEKELFTKEEIQNGTFYQMIPGLIDMCGVISFKNPVLLALQTNARSLANQTFLYTFDYKGEFNRYHTLLQEEDMYSPFDLGVSLTDENLYLFPWPWYAVLTSNQDLKIAKRMVDLWTSFAITGKPTAPGVPEWPPMTSRAGPYLKLGRLVTVGENYIDEYSITVKERRMGYSLVNEEFFETLEDFETDDTKKPINENANYTDVKPENVIGKEEQKQKVIR